MGCNLLHYCTPNETIYILIKGGIYAKINSNSSIKVDRTYLNNW